MVKISFFRDPDGNRSGFEVYDHAGAADAGYDIVCAAVSALTIHTANALTELCSDGAEVQQSEEDARIRVTVAGRHSAEAEVLLSALEMSFSAMEEEELYRDYIDVHYEEV